MFDKETRKRAKVKIIDALKLFYKAPENYSVEMKTEMEREWD